MKHENYFGNIPWIQNLVD